MNCWTKGLSALADKIQGQIFRWQFLSHLLHPHYTIQKLPNCQHPKMALRLYFIVIYSIFAARQNIELFWRDNGARSNLGTCFMPVASKSRSDCRWNVTHGVLLRLQFLQNQVIFLMIEHCRRQRCWGHWHHPYFWKLPRPNQSWFEIHYNDRRIPEEYFRKQLQVNQCTFDTLLNALRNTQKYTIVWQHCSRESTATGFVSSGAWELVRKYWAEFQCWLTHIKFCTCITAPVGKSTHWNRSWCKMVSRFPAARMHWPSSPFD